jgi:hypothetical protein
MVDAFYPQVGMAVAPILALHGLNVGFPPYQTCLGEGAPGTCLAANRCPGRWRHCRQSLRVLTSWILIYLKAYHLQLP